MNNPKNKIPEIMTMIEVADFFRVNTKTIRDLAIKGELPHFRIGKLYRFETKRVMKFFTGIKPSTDE